MPFGCAATGGDQTLGAPEADLRDGIRARLADDARGQAHVPAGVRRVAQGTAPGMLAGCVSVLAR